MKVILYNTVDTVICPNLKSVIYCYGPFENTTCKKDGCSQKEYDILYDKWQQYFHELSKVSTMEDALVILNKYSATLFPGYKWFTRCLSSNR